MDARESYCIDVCCTSGLSLYTLCCVARAPCVISPEHHCSQVFTRQTFFVLVCELRSGVLKVYFRSDKANMQPEEIAAKQQQASQLQDELKRQIEDKKRVKVPNNSFCHGLACYLLSWRWHVAISTSWAQLQHV